MKKYKICEHCDKKIDITNGHRSFTTHRFSCKPYKKHIKNVLNVKFLSLEYIINGKSACEIGQQFNVGASVVIRMLKKHKIPTRTIKQSKKQHNI